MRWTQQAGRLEHASRADEPDATPFPDATIPIEAPPVCRPRLAEHLT